MATIHKRRLRNGDVVWELTHGTGEDRQRFIAGRTREEADGVLRQFREQLALHGKAPDRISVKDAIARYTEFLGVNRRVSTARRYGRVLRTFAECFLASFHPSVVTLREVKPAHIEDYKRRRSQGEVLEPVSEEERFRELALRQELSAAPTATTRSENAKFGWLGRKRFRSVVTPRTINYELRTIATFLGWAVRNNYLFVNPAPLVERFRVPKRSIPKFLTADELKKFMAACKPEEQRLFMTIFLSGMRKGEIEHLTWNDVSFELAIVFIQAKKEYNWQPKTDERVIPISPLLREILLIQHQQRRNDGLVFPNMEGGIDTHILEKVKRVCQRAGIRPATVHELRHSFGAHLRMSGVSLADIADLLGHKDLATTQIYAKVHQEHLRAALAKLAPIAQEVTHLRIEKAKEARTQVPTTTKTSNEGGIGYVTLATTDTKGKPSGVTRTHQNANRDQEERDKGT